MKKKKRRNQNRRFAIQGGCVSNVRQRLLCRPDPDEHDLVPWNGCFKLLIEVAKNLLTPADSSMIEKAHGLGRDLI